MKYAIIKNKEVINVIIWDGKTKAGNIVNAGLYVVYFEAIHPTKSEKIIKKIPLAVTF